MSLAVGVTGLADALGDLTRASTMTSTHVNGHEGTGTAISTALAISFDGQVGTTTASTWGFSNGGVTQTNSTHDHSIDVDAGQVSVSHSISLTHFSAHALVPV